MNIFSFLWQKISGKYAAWKFERLRKARKLAIMNHRAIQTSQYWGRKMHLYPHAVAQYDGLSFRGMVYLGIAVGLSMLLALLSICGPNTTDVTSTTKMVYGYIAIMCATGIASAIVALIYDSLPKKNVGTRKLQLSSFTDDELIGELERRHPDCTNKGD